jgi:hypothetical protein
MDNEVCDANLLFQRPKASTSALRGPPQSSNGREILFWWEVEIIQERKATKIFSSGRGPVSRSFVTTKRLLESVIDERRMRSMTEKIHQDRASHYEDGDGLGKAKDGRSRKLNGVRWGAGQITERDIVGEVQMLNGDVKLVAGSCSLRALLMLPRRAVKPGSSFPSAFALYCGWRECC